MWHFDASGFGVGLDLVRAKLSQSDTGGRGFMVFCQEHIMILPCHELWDNHVVISGYGLWLPGDGRGHWSEAWDDELGFIEPHTLHAGDPVRLRMAEERRKHTPVRLDEAMKRRCRRYRHTVPRRVGLANFGSIDRGDAYAPIDDVHRSRYR